MKKIEKTDAQWREELTPEQYHVLREHGTDRAFAGLYTDEKTPGTYQCAGCGTALFTSETKYDSGSGWPAFTTPADDGVIAEVADDSHGMRRVEVRCATCDGHLGHVFPDGPGASGMRYCVNSAALKLDPDS